MKREYHRWHSPRLGIELGVVVYGHWGPPLLGFPTSAGDEFELEGQGMVGALADFIDAGKGIRHSLDNWGPEGGHDWPYWKHMMREYIARLF